MNIASERRIRRAWWAEQWVQVLLAMIAGVLLGAVRPQLGEQIQPLGDAFIKALVYFDVVTTCALLIGLTAVNLWRPGAGMNVDAAPIGACGAGASPAPDP